MNVCGSNLIPICITVICSGIIFFYFNSRLAEVKSAVEKQNRVLTAFIGNIQNDIRGGQCVMPMNDASASMNAGANHLASDEALHTVKHNEKIVVSDDEEYSDDSDSSDDDDDEQVIRISENLTLDVVKIDSSMSTVTIDDLKIVDLNLMSDAVVDITKTEVNGVDQMKVDDLRKMVSDNNLATKEEVKKLKKSELLSLLKK